MQIEHQRKSSSEDSWDPEQPQQQNNAQNQKKLSLFQKITISYDDQMIQKNVDFECEKPILNSELFPFKDQEDEYEGNMEETQQEPNENPKEQLKINQGFTMQEEEKKPKTKNVKPMQNEQALFNIVQDEQNQHWMRKKVKNGMPENSKISRPLTCPQCFTQICYVYEKCKQFSKKDKQLQNSQLKNNQILNQKTYKAKTVENVEIHEHKIIRNRFASQNMQKRLAFQQKQVIQKQRASKLQAYEKDLKQRYEDINVKILISCKQCGLDIGYWDANSQMFLLFNVI